MIKEDLKEIINSLKEIDYDTSSIEVKSGNGGLPKRIGGILTLVNFIIAAINKQIL